MFIHPWNLDWPQLTMSHSQLGCFTNLGYLGCFDSMKYSNHILGTDLFLGDAVFSWNCKDAEHLNLQLPFRCLRSCDTMTCRNYRSAVPIRSKKHVFPFPESSMCLLKKNKVNILNGECMDRIFWTYQPSIAQHQASHAGADSTSSKVGWTNGWTDGTNTKSYCDVIFIHQVWLVHQCFYTLRNWKHCQTYTLKKRQCEGFFTRIISDLTLIVDFFSKSGSSVTFLLW